MSDYYDRQGEPLADVLAFAALYEQPDYRRVAYTELDDEVYISTVWLGIDHDFTGQGPPLIFETMVFGGEFDEWQDRYSTETQALAGHDQMVAKARAHRDGDVS